MKPEGLLPGFLLGILLVSSAECVRADETGKAAQAAPSKALADALPREKWRQLENSVDRALAWLATQQEADGSFHTLDVGQPAITSLCVMAFLSRGHQPGFGPYGQQLNNAVDFVVSCQKEDGLLSLENPEPVFKQEGATHAGSYNHAIAGLMLGEAYGHVTGQRARKVKAAMAKAIQFTRALQTRPKPFAGDEGGLRYLRRRGMESDSDLSVTAWQLMFLRSARNAEFKVPQQYMNDGVAYVRRCWNPTKGMFGYVVPQYGDDEAGRGTTGAGIVSLSMAGQHNTAVAQAAGDWLVAHPFRSINESIGAHDRFYYSGYYCSQAAAQLGGHYWEKIFPPLLEVYLNAQEADGSFPPEPNHGDARLGRAYSTAMAVLAMTPAYQLLPVYQR